MLPPPHVRIITNTRLRNVYLNEQPVGFRHVSHDGTFHTFLIDTHDAKPLNIETIRMTITDIPEASIFTIQSSGIDVRLIAAAIFAMGIGVLLWAYYLHCRISKTSMRLSIIALCLVLSLCTLWQTLYVANTPAQVRTYDLPGHLEYITYMQYMRRIPPFRGGWEFFQPPLYYILTAAWASTLEKIQPLLLPLEPAGQLFSLVISVCSLCVIAYLGIELFQEKNQRLGAVLLVAVVGTVPGIVFLSSRISNDPLSFFMTLSALAILLKWNAHPTQRQWLTLSIVLVLAMLVKSNAMVSIVAAIICLLMARVRMKQKMQWMVLMMGILVIGVGWFTAWRTIVEGQRNVAGNTYLVADELRIRHTSPGMFVTFNPLMVLTHPFNNPWNDTERRSVYWEYLLRSAYFGEFSFPSVTTLGKVMLMGGMLSLLLTLRGIWHACRTRISVHKHLPLISTLVCSLLSLIVFRVSAPFASNQDFRYIPISAVILGYFAIVGAYSLHRKLQPLAFGILILAVIANASFIAHFFFSPW